MNDSSQDAELLELSSDALVLKANKLVDARQRLSLQEQRLILLLISQIRPGDESFGWFKIGIAEFAEFIGISDNKNIYSAVREAVRKLMQRVVTVDRDGIDMDLSWLYGAVYGEKGYVHLCIHPVLKPYLLNLSSQFTKYYLSCVMHLKSCHSIRIYELLKRFEFLEEVEFDIDKFRHLMGFSENEYRLYGHFKSRVLLPSQAELQEKTDISFSVTEIKKRRKIVGLRFLIKPNAPFESYKPIPELPLCDEPDQMHPTLGLVDDCHLPGSISHNRSSQPKSLDSVIRLIPEEFRTKYKVIEGLQRYLERNGEEYVERNVVYTNEMSNETGPLRDPWQGDANYIAYLFKSLENDYGLESEQRKRLICAELDASNRQKKEDFLARKAKVEEESLLIAKRQKCEQLLESLPKEEFEALREKAIASLPPEISRTGFGELPIRLKMQELIAGKYRE